MNAKLIASTILAGLTIVFFIQNVAVVELRLFLWTLSISEALLMFLVLSLGVILGWLLHGTFSRRKSNTRTKHASVAAR